MVPSFSAEGTTRHASCSYVLEMEEHIGKWHYTTLSLTDHKLTIQ